MVDNRNLTLKRDADKVSSLMLPYIKMILIQTNLQLINILENKRCVCVCE